MTGYKLYPDRGNHVDGAARGDLAVCILFFERLEQSLECVEGYLPSGVNIYILNNGSSRDAREALGDFCAGYRQVKIFDSEQNLGVARGRNLLISQTTEQWLLFVDNDTRMKTRKWLPIIKKAISAQTGTDAFIPRILKLPERVYAPTWHLGMAGGEAILEDWDRDEPTNCFPGGASFCSREMFKRLGLYDEAMFAGFEDFELCIRAIRLGAPIQARRLREIEIVHEHRHLDNEYDRRATLVRYDDEILEKSFQNIASKHNLVLESDWREWAGSQVDKLMDGQRREAGGSWKRLVPEPIKRAYREVRALTGKARPRTCTLFVTDRCNFSCAMCRRAVIEKSKGGDMSLETARKALEVYPSLDAFTIAVFGEPALCPDLIPIIEFLKDAGKHVGVITNGYKAIESSRIRQGPDYISISLYGHDKQSYSFNTGVDAFEAVIGNY